MTFIDVPRWYSHTGALLWIYLTFVYFCQTAARSMTQQMKKRQPWIKEVKWRELS